MPDFIKDQLWGDRKKWGSKPNILDEDWSSWQSTYDAFYSDNQRDGIGLKINDTGYQILAEEDFTGKVVLEIGPGDIRHMKFWQSKPTKYLLADIDIIMLYKGEKILKTNDIPLESVLLERSQMLPFQDNSIDYIVTFYSLEHIDPIDYYLLELKRILKTQIVSSLTSNVLKYSSSLSNLNVTIEFLGFPLIYLKLLIKSSTRSIVQSSLGGTP